MAEYIEREAALRTAHIMRPEDKCLEAAMANIPAADIDRPTKSQFKRMAAQMNYAPVVHGRWTSPHWKNSNYCCNCSECGEEAMHREYQWNSKGIYPICPNCGARMDGDA